MNAILTLRGKRFSQKSRKGVMGQITIPQNTEISPTHLEDLLVSLKELKDRWNNEQIIKGLLVIELLQKVIVLVRFSNIRILLLMKQLWEQNLTMIKQNI